MMEFPKKILRILNFSRKNQSQETNITILPEESSIENNLLEMGWEKEPYGYRGHIRGCKKSFKALFVKHRDSYRFCIKNLPQNVISGRFCHSILNVGDGWWLIDYVHSPNPVGVISHIEEYFREVGE